MFYLKKNKKRMLALCLSAALSVGSLTVYAATEQWNDASLTIKMMKSRKKLLNRTKQ